MLASVFAAFSAKKSDKPNIVFILCDDMGYGDLGCYGQKYIETPTNNNRLYFIDNYLENL